MKKSVIILIALVLGFQNLSAQEFHWANQSVGDPNNGTAEGCDLVCDQEGNTYVAGNFNNAVNFGALEISGNYGTMYVVKYSTQGDPEWVRQINGNSNNEIFGIACDDQQNIYICGMYKHTNSNTILDFGSIQIEGNASLSTFIAKLDKDGNWLWAKSFLSDNLAGSQVCKPDEIMVTPQGDVFLAGILNTQVTIEGDIYNTENGSDEAYYFSRLSSDGDLTWFKSNKGIFDGIELALASNGEIVFSGTANNTIYFSDENIEGPGSDDVLFGSLSQDGNLLWWQTAGHMSYNEQPAGLALDQDNNIYMAFDNYFFVKIGDQTINYNGTVTQYLYKFDNQGNYLWMQPLSSGFAGGPNGIPSLDIITCSDGKTYVTGICESAMYIGYPIFFSDTLGGFGYKECYLAGYNSDGTYAGVSTFVFDENNGGNGEFVPSQLAFDQNMNITLTGTFKDSLLVGNKMLNSGSLKQMFLIKANPSELFDFSTSQNYKQLQEIDLKIYPNPAGNTLNIYITENNKFSRYQLIDIFGRILFSGFLADSNISIDISRLEKGTYFVSLINNNQAGSKPFIKL